MLRKAFLDTSVLGNFIILSRRLKSSDIESKVILDSLQEHKFKQPLNCYNFFKFISESEYPEDTFFISDIVISELFTVLTEQYRGDKLYNTGIPVKFWSRLTDPLLQTSDRHKVNEPLFDFLKEFIHSKKITSLLQPPYSFGDVSDLNVYHRVISIDSILVAVAIQNKCEYFITVDGRLIDALKKYKKIKVVLPDTYLNATKKS